MEKSFELSRLLDCYGVMLTDRQRSFLDQHINEDCSLFEIAEREGISRQGVRDALKRGEEQLYELEAKLGMLARKDRLIEGLTEIKRLSAENAEIEKKIDSLIGICEDTYGV